MSLALERAKSSWLLAFGDLVTLLITFFIITLAMNKGEITKVQAWVDSQIEQSFVQLNSRPEIKASSLLSIKRTSNGILITISSDQAFASAATEPSAALKNELAVLKEAFTKLTLLHLDAQPGGDEIIQQAKEQGWQWLPEVIIGGHTDNDPVDPASALQSNFLLSSFRAQAVMNVLLEQSNLDAQLFSVAGFGEYQPMASNASATGKQQNRRVEILVTASFQKIR